MASERMSDFSLTIMLLILCELLFLGFCNLISSFIDSHRITTDLSKSEKENSTIITGIFSIFFILALTAILITTLITISRNF